MASSYETFKDLNLSKDEVERFTDALKDKNFRKLLVDYVDEVRDPENQKLFQKEITQFEKERGVDVTFINPVAAYVIKTSVDGSKKAFINICANEHINKPTSLPAYQEGSRGLQWSLPHSLAPPREDLDKKGVRCQVYDVVFHPDTVHLAHKNKAFRQMVNNTALEAVESNYEVVLDRKNLKFPNLQYKGMAQAAVIRKASNEKPPEISSEERELMDKFYAESGIPDFPPKPTSPKKTRYLSKKTSEDDAISKYTTPKYIIKHRRHIELEEFTETKTSKINLATPKELVVEISLPLLKSSADIALDVAEKTLQLISEKPAKYKLSLTLPYRVNQDVGNAKFDKDKKKLVVTLPVKQNKSISLTEYSKDDSGVDSDPGSLISSSPVEDSQLNSSLIEELTEEKFQQSNLKDNLSELDQEDAPVGQEMEFLNPDLHYSLPEFCFNLFESTIILTLNVKNVDGSSIEKYFNETASDFQIKFSSVSSGFYPLHYAFFLRLPCHTIETEKLSIEAWDNNVIVQINYKPCDNKIESYLYGLSEYDLTVKQLEIPSIMNVENCETLEETAENVDPKKQIADPASESKNERKKGKGRKSRQHSNSLSSVEFETTETEDEDKQDKCSKMKSFKKQSVAINMVRNFSESSGDETSRSLSPAKGRGILKSLSRQFERSVSESGLDDAMWLSSIENFPSVDSIIPEECELSTSLKKTVRFNDNVSRQLYRSNSSILGQRKKNQRKAKAKKRAQERRHSEGDVLENEDKKERDGETGDESESNECNEQGNNEDGEKKYFSSHIFEPWDMN